MTRKKISARKKMNKVTESELESAIESMYMAQEAIEEALEHIKSKLSLFDNIEDFKYSSSTVEARIIGMLQNVLENSTGEAMSLGELIEVLEEEYNNFVYTE
jgi:uncharacterized membrane-anchored protein YjiN (DUF445 family)